MKTTAAAPAWWRGWMAPPALPQRALPAALPLALAVGMVVLGALLTGCAAPTTAPTTAIAPDPHMVGLAARGRVGRSMDEDDRRVVAQALETTPAGTPLRWANDETAYRFELRAVRDYAGTIGRCREYAVDRTTADGAREHALSRACRRANGDWRLAE